MKKVNSGKLLSGLVLFAMAEFLVMNANGNGHVKATGVEKVLLTAKCTAKDGTTQTVLFRAAIRGGDGVKPILHVKRDGWEQDIELYDVSDILFTDNGTVHDGFAEASITLRGYGTHMAMKVRIADKDNVFAVTGYDSHRRPMEVVLTTCKEIEVSPISDSQDGEQEPTGVPRDPGSEFRK